MKKILTSLASFVLLFICVSYPFAKPVDLDSASRVGAVHLQAQEQFWKKEPFLATDAFVRGQKYSILGVRKLEDGEKTIAYIFDLIPEGYIAISTDTDIRPVISYSFEGTFPMEDTPDNILLHLLKWDMKNRLKALQITSKELKTENNTLWEAYLVQEESFIDSLISAVQWGPWLQTTWKQSDPYNKYCPMDPVTIKRSVTGCGATAMAQIINYWKYPHSVSFSDADDYTTNTRGIKIDDDYSARDFPSFTDLNQKLSDIRYDGNEDEIAALSFACGIAIKTDYTSTGSASSFGTGSDLIYKNKFKYASARVRFTQFHTDFYDILQQNMKDARPAQVAIHEKQGDVIKKGHAVVADGFKDSGEYHLNFGWGGYRDAWYFLPNGMPEGYNTVFGAVVDIYSGYGPFFMTVLTPNGGEKIKGGSVYNITWNATGSGIDHVRLQYSTNGVNYENIVNSTPNDGAFEWTTPQINSATVRIKAITEDASNYLLAYDISDANFTIDSIAPSTTAKLTGTQGLNGWYTSDVTVQLSATDNLTGIKETKYKINTGAWETYSAPFTVTGSTVYYYSEDNAGNIEAEKSVQVKIDKTAPVTPVVTDDGDYTADGTKLHASWTSSDAESGISGYEYAIGKTPGGSDVAPWTSVGTNTDVTKSGLSLTDGQKYYFAVKAKNNAGLVSTGISDGITYRLPRTLTILTPNGGEKIKGGTVYNITWNTTGGDIDHIRLRYSTNGGSDYQDIETTQNDGVFEWNIPSTINSSAMRIKAIAEDTSNNALAEDESNADFTVDSTPPSTTASLSGTQGENGWYTSNVTVQLSATDNLTGIKETKYRINAGNWETYSSQFVVSGSTVNYYSKDSVGNIEAEKHTEIKIDKTPPATPVVTDDGDYTNSNNQLHASWASSDTESGISGYEYAIGTAEGGSEVVPWTPVGTNTGVTKTGLSLLSGQTYYFSVKAKNNAGLTSIGNSNGIICQLPKIGVTPASLTFNAATGVSNPYPQKLNITNTGYSTLNWTISDNADWLSCLPVSGDCTTETDEVTVSVDISGLSAGTHNAVITISSANASNSPQTVPVTLSIFSIPEGSFTIWVLGLVDLEVTDPEGGKIDKDTSTIPFSIYSREDLDGDGNLDDIVIIASALLGSYSIRVTPEPGAKPTDTYTLYVSYDKTPIMLAGNIQIQNIPAEPYSFFFPLRNMEQGWNLISMPVQLSDTALSKVLESIAGHYQAVWGYNSGWKRCIVGGPPEFNDLDKIESKKGYWVRMLDKARLKITGNPITNPEILLNASWNLVGYDRQTARATDQALSSISNKCLSAWGYDAIGGWKRYVPGAGDNSLETMRPGDGYWLNVTGACTWDVSATVPSPAPPADRGFGEGYVSSGMPEIPYIIWGNVEVDGVKNLKPAPAVVLKVDNRVQSSCQLKRGIYMLDVPVNIASSMQVELYVQFDDISVKAGLIPQGKSGDIIRFDLSIQTPPKVSMLHQNYPNPFNPETWIPYQLQKDADIEIRIYTSTGQLVRTLNLGHKPAGFYTDKVKSAYWDGRNEAGEYVTSGVYFYSIRADEYTAIRKMVIVR